MVRSFASRLSIARHAAVVIALAGTGACVNTPLHNEYVDPTDGDVFFNGYANGPTRVMTVQARRKDTGQWVTISSTASRSAPTLVRGDTGYYWSTSVNVDSIGSWRCFYTASCTTPTGTLWAQYRVREQGNPVVTMTKQEATCVRNQLDIGTSPTDAYDICAGTNRQTMTLYWYRETTFPGDPPIKVDL